MKLVILSLLIININPNLGQGILSWRELYFFKPKMNPRQCKMHEEEYDQAAVNFTVYELIKSEIN